MARGGWSRQKREAFEAAFYDFLDHCFVNSRDLGHMCLGEHLYEGQRWCITQILDALEAGIHKIYILKSRQLGISTIIRALSVFYIGLHKGLGGALVFDTAPNRENARRELVTMIKDLPGKIKFPGIKGTGEGNREGITLINDSYIQFKSAGVKKSKSSGTLGRSVGLAFAHLSELCSYDNDEGLIAFEESLSDVNPDRLYIYESTARGYNRWRKIWKAARKDPAHCKCIFLGWWSKDSQRIERDDLDWNLYGDTPPTEDEAERIKLVRDLYGIEIDPEQLAWIRRKMDPAAQREGDADPDFSGDDDEDDDVDYKTFKIQEQPWVEDDAFQQTGAIFFPSATLTKISNQYVEHKCKTAMYLAGLEFFQMRVVMPAPTTRNIDLKIWEEPDPDGWYVMGVDPAYGEDEDNDRSSIQVFRCFADGLDQVAEYASPLVSTSQLAWVIASLLGWYGASRAQIKYALELNGPGTAVFTELRALQRQIDSGYQAKEIAERGLQDVFRNVRTYLYSRPDALQGGLNYHIKTTALLKVTFMERLRDYVVNEQVRIRSHSLIDEMRSIGREGDTIKAPGSLKDDRVLAAAFAVHCWETGARRELITRRLTRDAVAAQKRLSLVDQVALFNQNTLAAFFKQKRVVRAAQHKLAVRNTWRYR